MHIQDESTLLNDDEWTLLCMGLKHVSRIFNVLAHERKKIQEDKPLPRHIILTLGQPVFALTP